ncbi:PKD domain-containing protein [Methanofollis tationis]|uniref:PKD domain-containing protein n=1 Tax=Methanofollis tationis TaxID=81417 RepID=A0A7K4HPN2_9EURY|nr:PKD domain-containing protein [Methanofollis tationis]NVO66798.1 PKD domain-containing protein [Methanofollis tationis]
MYRTITAGAVLFLLLLVAAPAWAQPTDETAYMGGAAPLDGQTAAAMAAAADGVTVIWKGTVEIDPDGRFALVPLNTGIPLDVSRNTPLGALDAASALDTFTYGVWEANWGLLVYRVNDIQIGPADDGEVHIWWFYDIGGQYITNNPTFKSLSDGEWIRLIYAPMNAPGNWTGDPFDYIVGNSKYVIDMTVDFADDGVDFTADVTEGPAPLTVGFTDTSGIENITAWWWDFGVDNATSEEQNPVYTYEEPGTYTVSLTVTDDAGADDTLVREDYITVVDGMSIYETAATDGNFTMLVTALDLTGLNATLDAPGTYTVFAPTDEAIATLPPDLLDAMLNDTVALTGILLYHVAGETYRAADLIPLDEVETLLGPTVAITWDEANQTLMVNDATVIVADIECSNGVIHAIDLPLFPPDEPGADFEADVLAGTAPLTVGFTDTSAIENITAWWWDFGNGYMCTLEAPLFTYHTPGVFNVSLAVTDDEGRTWTAVKEGYVTVTAPVVPEANFTAEPTEGYAPLTVGFTDTSTVEKIVAWAWELGDGGTSQEQHPVYTYGTPGLYTVSLTVTDEANATYTVTKPDYIAVLEEEEEESADFEADVTSGAAPLAVQFTDLSTVKNITAWAWEFGDNGTSEEQHPVHVYTENGTYDVGLTVYKGLSASYWEIKYEYIRVD